MDILFAYLFIFCRWLILPVFLIINLNNIINHKKYLKNAGLNIVLKKTKKLHCGFTIAIICLSIVWIIRFILIKKWIAIIGITSVLSLITIIISINLYANINGIYQNGIIFNEYIIWDKIHSYKWINNNTISFLMKNGNRIDFGDITINKEIIIEIIKKSGIYENTN